MQRLSTLIKFFSTEIFGESVLATEENNELEQNNIRVGALLCGAPLVGSLEGFTLKTLPETLTRTLRYTRIPIIVLEKESSKRARFHVFKRLNRSGSVLSDQEIRNCSARLFGNEFPEALRRFADSDAIKNALSLSEDQAKRMGVEELVLRLLANVYSPTPLKHSVIEFLDEFMEFASEGKFSVSADISRRIEESFEHIAKLFPAGEAFRFWRGGKAQGQFSSNLFDIVSYGVYKNIDSLVKNPERTKIRIEELLQGEEIKGVTGAGSNTKRKHLNRLELGETWFSTQGV